MDTLIDKYFFVFDNELNIVQAGKVLGPSGPDHYLISWDSQIDGSDVEIELTFVVARATMACATVDKPWLAGEFWQFFNSAEERDTWFEALCEGEGDGDEEVGDEDVRH